MNKPIYTTNRPNPYTHRIQWEYSEQHYHAFWECVLITKGQIKHFCNGVKTELTAGHLMIVRPTDVHYYKLDGANHLGYLPPESKAQYEHRDIYIDIKDMDDASEFLKQTEIIDYILRQPHPLILSLNVNQINMFESKLNRLEFYHESQKPIYDAIHKSVICDILSIVIEHNAFATTDYPDWLNNLLYQMNTPNILSGTIDDVVKASNFSHGHLCRMFKQYTGERIIDTYTKFKMQYACKLLMDPNLTILMIGTMVGYESPSNFLNQFKKFTGLTPNLWRKKYLKSQID